MGIYRLIQTKIYFIRLEALKTPTSETPDFGGHVTSLMRFNTSGPADPLGFDWEGLAASRGTVGGQSGPPILQEYMWERLILQAMCYVLMTSKTSPGQKVSQILKTLSGFIVLLLS